MLSRPKTGSRARGPKATIIQGKGPFSLGLGKSLKSGILSTVNAILKPGLRGLQGVLLYSFMLLLQVVACVGGHVTGRLAAQLCAKTTEVGEAVAALERMEPLLLSAGLRPRSQDDSGSLPVGHPGV